MKRRELILDFTSLLDVILILLFMVIVNINQASLTANEETERELVAAQAQIKELSDDKEDLLMEIESIIGREISYADISLEMESLKSDYDALLDEYDYLKLTSDYDPKDTSLYEAALERLEKVTLICETSKNEETGNYEVNVKVYKNGDKNDGQTFADSVILEHNMELTKEERTRLKAKQVTELTKALSTVIRDVDLDMIWFSVQYYYEDENFSNMDLEIMNEAIENIERMFSKKCHIEKIKL